LLTAVCLLPSALAVQRKSAEGRLKVPHYDWGGCPFECCGYTQWTARRDIVIRKGRHPSSPEAFGVKKGERVQGLTGVVISWPGRIRVLRRITLDRDDPVELEPGDVIYSLHYLGEGYYLFWAKGKTHSHRINAEKLGVQGDLEILSVPRFKWWVRIRNSRGQVGWSDEPHHFDNVDGCA